MSNEVMATPPKAKVPNFPPKPLNKFLAPIKSKPVIKQANKTKL